MKVGIELLRAKFAGYPLQSADMPYDLVIYVSRFDRLLILLPWILLIFDCEQKHRHHTARVE